MKRYIRIIDSFYLLLLAVGIGAVVACGAFAAPVIFHINEFIPEITQLESGLIMGRIFVRLNSYLVILMVIMGLYESVCLYGGIVKKNIPYSLFWFLLAVINSICIALFAYYYTPFILDSANIASENFADMHAQSVLVFKILLFGLGMLFIWRAYILHYMRIENKA